MRCVDCQNQMLDLVYGLLDTAEAAALESHVADCPACAAAKAAAAGEQALIARAAKSSFPSIEFRPPVEGVIVPKRPTTRTVMIRWAVAAGVILAVAGTVGPTVQNSIRRAAIENGVRDQLLAVRSAREVWQLDREMLTERKRSAETVLESAVKAHDTVVTQWVNAEAAVSSAKSFAVEVTGPASAVAGAPNDYRIRVADPIGQPVAAALDVTVTDSAGKVRAEAKFDPAAPGVTFRLPASVWTDLPSGTGLTLTVTATDPATGQKSRLAEPINLLPPVYATFLTTDRPLYQPGDTLFFRSLTLDRARFIPPDRDLVLRFDLLDPRGAPVKGLSLTGRSSPAISKGDELSPVLGPDGKPIRGIGCGAFALPANLPTGEYALVAYEIPVGWTKSELPDGTVPLAKRKVQIRKHVPTRYSTSLTFDATGYRPGDTVAATFTANVQGRPLVNAPIMTAVTVNGRRVTPRAPFNLDAAGSARIEIALPVGAAINTAEVTVTILQGDAEIVTRPIPLATQPVVDFFPEGGDLVAGVEGRVYFRARTADGKPVEFRGELFEGEKAITPVATVGDRTQLGSYRGHGVFSFTPEAGKKYVVRGPAGEFALPAIKDDGVVMTIPAGVVGAAQPITVKLASGKVKKSVLVVAYSRGRPVASARATLETGKALTLDLKPDPQSPGGVTRITVFEEEEADGPGRKVLTPVAERLVFRRPAEALVLSYATSQSGPQSIGARVDLTVTAKTEAGQPTAAILWAAVVNETIFGTADDRTTRGLPAHFFVCSEVEKPDDLEFADFLLTDHPKAAESLDLVLGTQGWRRFAEQAPEVFRRTAPPDDADRLMVAVGSRGPVPAEFRPLVQKVADRYRPEYEQALARVESAERRLKVASTPDENVRTQYSLALAGLVQVQGTRRSGDGWMEVQVPVAIGMVILAGVLAFVRYRLFRRGAAERRYLGVAATVAVALAGFLFLTSGQRRGAGLADEELRRAGANGITFSAVNPYGTYQPPPAVRVNPQHQLTERPDSATGQIVRAVAATTAPPGIGTPLESAAGNRTVLQKSLVHDSALNDRIAGNYSSRIAARLTPTPPTPAGQRVRDEVPKHPPFVVREYRHDHAEQRFQAGNAFDATDTVLWQPVLVVPGSGTIDLGFHLSGSTAGYRVVIAGHTLDGRVGSVTGRMPSLGTR